MALLEKRWIQGMYDTVVGSVPRVKTTLDFADRLNTLRARIGRFRMRCSIEPGLYAVGSPDAGSPVLVTANYKLSFDALRTQLPGYSAWILVLDTKGINVWCAAGKGTFGTGELVQRIRNHQLDLLVQHRRIILPQLGATGVQAHAVLRETGFTVVYGPVYARDLPGFIANGLRAVPEMRLVKFTLRERAAVIPIEVSQSGKYLLYLMIGTGILFGLQPEGLIFRAAVSGGYHFGALGLASVFAGSVAVPLLLPLIPFRSFALKGWVSGLAVTLAYLLFVPPAGDLDSTLQAASLLLFPAAASYLALNFTGATPLTNPSGVRKEVQFALPAYAVLAAAAFILIILYKLKEWNLL